MSKIEIKTITTDDGKKFTSVVNEHLNNGWELHGEPQISHVGQQDSWDGRQRAWVEVWYTQILKKQN